MVEIAPGAMPLDLFGMSGIKVRYFKVPSPAREYLSYLIVRFEGAYRDGSAGNPDARYMYAMAQAGSAAFDVFGLVLDCTALSYRWGDKLDLVLASGYAAGLGEPLHLALVVGPDCAPAVATLVWGPNASRQATEKEWIFDTVPQAVTYLDQCLAAQEALRS